MKNAESLSHWRYPQSSRLRNASLALGIVASALLLTVLISATQGAVTIGIEHWLQVLKTIPILSGESGPASGAAHVLAFIRLPRIALAALIGAALGLAGLLTQGLFRNPLADPGLLGVTSGAACAAALTMVLFSNTAAFLPTSWQPFLLPLSAFIGALTICFFLDSLARLLTPGSVAGLLLTGLAINAVASSVIGLATYIATDEQLRSLAFWTLGSVASANWAIVSVMTALLLIAVMAARRMSARLNALALGDSVAIQIGINLGRLRWAVIAVVALTCGAAVAWCGMIGFVGLLAPHMARQWIGADQRQLLPLSMTIGAWLLLSADTMARTVAMPAEIPVGIFTALIGGPTLLFMLRSMVAGREGIL